MVGIVLFLMKLLLRWNFHPTFVATFSPFVADRRATARTTATLSHAASRQKKAMIRGLVPFTSYACFEQARCLQSWPLPRKAAMLVLPGDKMFLSQFVTTGKTRPVFWHGYGNAKRAMKQGLTSIAVQGWQPIAFAMVGAGSDPPIWVCNDWRPILGTSPRLLRIPTFTNAGQPFGRQGAFSVSCSLVATC